MCVHTRENTKGRDLRSQSALRSSAAHSSTLRTLWSCRETSAVSLRAAVLGGDPGFLKENNTLPNKSKGCDKKTGHVHVTTRVHRILTHTHTPMVALPGHIPHPCKHTHISPWPLCAEVDGAVDVIGENRRNGLCVGFDRRFDLCPLVGLGGRLLCGAR